MNLALAHFSVTYWQQRRMGVQATPVTSLGLVSGAGEGERWYWRGRKSFLEVRGKHCHYCTN